MASLPAFLRVDEAEDHHNPYLCSVANATAQMSVAREPRLAARAG